MTVCLRILTASSVGLRPLVVPGILTATQKQQLVGTSQTGQVPLQPNLRQKQISATQVVLQWVKQSDCGWRSGRLVLFPQKSRFRKEKCWEQCWNQHGSTQLFSSRYRATWWLPNWWLWYWWFWWDWCSRLFWRTSKSLGIKRQLWCKNAVGAGGRAFKTFGEKDRNTASTKTYQNIRPW